MVDTPTPNEDMSAPDNRQKRPANSGASPQKKNAKAKSPVRSKQSRTAAQSISEDASSIMSGATRALRTQAQTVSQVARRNPGTTTSILGTVGFLGFCLGVLVGRALSEDTRRHWY
ncbi:hypothetical protein [Phyllobacterium lublinensis]|uniref:hypothetical protein n=1 Tax=Phyllobacterium lublinensis TaxID=2875708 RepID=UPI001CCDC993|nr:hypothetical protein [Phyllobacterium sp. 2063]MBZ9655185.1 hypothetical protein [Phyllobacterium sp. 2063]